AQIAQGVWSLKTVSVGDLFAGALIPGLMLVAAYVVYVLIAGWRMPRGAATAELPNPGLWRLCRALLPPVLLIVAVLGSIIAGYATATEAAGVGAFGALLLSAAHGRLKLADLGDTARQTIRVTTMVFMILFGASMFSMTFS